MKKSFYDALTQQLDERYEDLLIRALKSDQTIGAIAEMVPEVHSRKEAVKRLRNVLEAQVIGSVLSDVLRIGSPRENFTELIDSALDEEELQDIFESWDRQVSDERLAKELDNYIFEFDEEDPEPKTQAPVPLSLVHDAVEAANEFSEQFLDVRDMKVEMLFDDPMITGDDDAELREQIDEEFNERYFRLPSQYDINEYEIMESFIEELEDNRTANELARAIQGRGAFRRFREACSRHRLTDKWYAFQDEAYWRIAERWCRSNDIPYIDDRKKD